MDDPYAPEPVAGWYMPAAIVSLLFMALGCATYVLHVTTDPATLPLDQRAAFQAEPAWVTVAYAIAVWAGAAGTLFLVLKRKLAETLLFMSLLAVVAWLGGILLVPGLRDALSANDIGVAAVVALLTWTIYGFARHSRQRGWLK